MKKVFAFLGLMLLLVIAYPAVGDDDHMDDDHWKGQSDEHRDMGKGGENRRNVEIEVEMYNNRSKVEVEIDGRESEFILHTVNRDEIVEAITNRTGLDRAMVESNMKIEMEDSGDSSEMDETRELHIEIEVEIYDNWSKVEIEINGSEKKLVLHTVNTDEIIDTIVNETGLNRDVVVNNIRIEIEDSMEDSWKYFHGKERFEEKRIKYREIMERKEEKREHFYKKYSESKNMYQKMKEKGIANPVVFNATKDYVIYGIGFVIIHLDTLELKIMEMNFNNTEMYNFSDEISSIRSELEYWREKINSSTTPQELRENVLAFSSEWKALKIKISAITGKVLSLKLLDVIEQAESSSSRIESKINELENMGIETTDVREAYGRYLEGLASAKVHTLNSVSHFSNALNSTDFSMAKDEFINGKTEYRKAVSEMKKSLNYLKIVFKDYRDALRNVSGGE